jgi:hypothetical protein
MSKNDKPTFLGIRFDHLNYKNQWNYLNDVCVKRLIIIKIHSYKFNNRKNFNSTL